MLIYKIFRDAEWVALQAKGVTDGAPIDLADGFIHFSTADQALETAAKHFAGVDQLWLAALDADSLGEALTWEPSRGGALFPHLYRPLQMEEVTWCKPLPLSAGQHLFPEPVTGHVDPTRDQFTAFKALNRDHPVEMLNLVRFRDLAAYPQDHAFAAKALTGAEAYAQYGRATGEIFAGLGGEIIWRGQFETTLIGPTNEAWDEVFIARYPTAHAFLSMVTDARYRKAVVNRQAAVATSRLVRCAPASTGTGFA